MVQAAAAGRLVCRSVELFGGTRV